MNELDKELAEQATTIEYGADRGFDRVTFDKEKFADLIRADEREACAEVCDELQQQWRPAGECADAIRERGNT